MWTSMFLYAATLLSLGDGLCHSYLRTYYDELGCVPETKDADGCPTSYDCSARAQRSADKCYYMGKAYDKGERLKTSPDTECLAACFCSERAEFTCAHVDCPEFFQGPPGPGCYFTYKHGDCCRSDEVCVSEDSAEQKTRKPVCEYKGQTYNLGQKFYPDEPCTQCICQEGFNGSLVEPHCRKIRCNLEIHNAEEIAAGCTPVYYGENSCCPISWRCPEPSDSVMAPEASDTKPSQSSGKTCKFGKLTLQVGERLSPDASEPKVECSCKVPPHPTCVQPETDSA